MTGPDQDPEVTPAAEAAQAAAAGEGSAGAPAGAGAAEASGEATDRAASQASQASQAHVVSEAERNLQAALLKSAENHELYLRARAEAENIRRRGQEEVAKAHKFAIESFAESLVPAVDSLEKALQVEGATAEAMRAGVEATLRQLLGAFERNRLVPIDPVGQKFDPHRHQAIAAVPVGPASGGVPDNHVVQVLQKGWMIADRVLRPAMVSVAKADPS